MGHLWNIYGTYPEIFVGYNMQHEIYGLYLLSNNFIGILKMGQLTNKMTCGFIMLYLQMEGSLKCNGLGSDFSILFPLLSLINGLVWAEIRNHIFLTPQIRINKIDMSGFSAWLPFKQAWEFNIAISHGVKLSSGVKATNMEPRTRVSWMVSLVVHNIMIHRIFVVVTCTGSPIHQFTMGLKIHGLSWFNSFSWLGWWLGVTPSHHESSANVLSCQGQALAARRRLEWSGKSHLCV